MKSVMTLILLCAPMFAARTSTDWITSLGGTCERDAAGRVLAVNLRGSWVNDAQMFALAQLPDLERLDLSHTRISDEGLLRLKDSRKIRDLNLFYSEWITDQGLTAIRGWKNLRRLNLRGTRISDPTLELVSHIVNLEALDIAQTGVTDNGLDYLITLVKLKELSLGRGRLNTTAMEMVRMLPTLTYLDVSGARPTPPDMSGRTKTGDNIPESSLRAIAELKDLRVLKLGYSSVNGDGLKILSSLEKLTKLGLEGCQRIDDKALSELTHWKTLKYVDAQDTAVTAAGIQAFRTAEPNLIVLTTPESQ